MNALTVVFAVVTFLHCNLIRAQPYCTSLRGASRTKAQADLLVLFVVLSSRWDHEEPATVYLSNASVFTIINKYRNHAPTRPYSLFPSARARPRSQSDGC